MTTAATCPTDSTDVARLAARARPVRDGGHDDAAERAARRDRLAVVPAADGLRRRQPVAVRRLRSVRSVADPQARLRPAVGPLPVGRAPDDPVRSDRPARPLHRHALPRRGRSPGRSSPSSSASSRRRSRRRSPAPAGRRPARSPSRRARRSTRTSAGSPSSALMVVVHSQHEDRRRPGLQGSGRPRVSTLKSDSRVKSVVAAAGRACRSRATATPRSSRPAPPRTPTRWSAPPTTSRPARQAAGRRRHRSP